MVINLDEDLLHIYDCEISIADPLSKDTCEIRMMGVAFIDTCQACS